MRLRTAAAATALAIAAVPVLAGCATYEEKREECAAKIAHMDNPPRADDPRPDECEDVSDKDYGTITMARYLRDSGAVDDDGNINLDE